MKTFKYLLNRLEVALFGFKLYAFRRAMHYWLRVDWYTHNESKELLNEFASNLLGFIKENPTKVLAPLHVTTNQLKFVYVLIDAVDNQALHSTTFNMITLAAKAPALLGKYKTRTILTESQDMVTTTYLVYWDVAKKSPLYAVMGDFGDTAVSNLHFLVLDAKAESVEQVQQFLERLWDRPYQIQLYQDGTRIVATYEFQTPGERGSTTEQYYLLGSFEAGEQTFWVYGYNEGIHQITTSEKTHDALSQLKHLPK